MKIVAKTLQGHMVELDVEASDNGESVRRRIEEATGYPADDIRLVFRGQNVEDSVTLSSLSVSEGDTVFMVTKVTPGGGDRPLADLAQTMANVTISSDATGQSFGFSSSSSSGDVSKLADYVSGLSSRDEAVLYESVMSIRKLLSVERDPPIGEVVSSGGVPLLVDLVQNSSSSNRVKFEAAWALTNIASGTSEHTRLVVEKGGLEAMVEGLLSDYATVREQCVWCLANIVGDGPGMRDRCHETEAVGKLVAMLNRDPSTSERRNIAWCLSNLVRGKPSVSLETARPILTAMAQLIFVEDDDILMDATWGLSYISDGANERIQAVIESGVIRRLVELLMSPNDSIVVPALRTLGNIATGDNEQTNVVIQAGLIPMLTHLLASPRKGIRREACWTLSNITAGTTAQIQIVIDSGAMPALRALLSEAEFDVKKEAAWAIANAAMGGTREQRMYLLEIDCAGPMAELLSTSDTRIVRVALEFFQQMANDLEERREMLGDLLEGRLEALMDHTNSEVYELAMKLSSSLLGDENDEEDCVSGGGFGESTYEFVRGSKKSMAGNDEEQATTTNEEEEQATTTNEEEEQATTTNEEEEQATNDEEEEEGAAMDVED